MSEERTDKQHASNTVAAIDIGSNSLRMVIADVLPDGKIEILERLQQAIRLGQDTFQHGRIGARTMKAAIDILRNYRRALGLYRVKRLRAVATSAVREAGNADTFLDRILMATDFRVEIIATSEENRLTVAAVRRAVGDAMGINKDKTLICEVGGGSTLLTTLSEGQVDTSESLRLGSMRLQETLRTSTEHPQRSAELMRQQIAIQIDGLNQSMPLKKVRSFVAIGGDARFAAREVGEPTDQPGLRAVEQAALDKLVRRCRRLTADELAKNFGLSFAEAETLTPALLVYLALLRKTSTKKLLVAEVSLRDGMLLDLAEHVTGHEDKAMLRGAIRSAMAIAEKFHVNLDHAQNVVGMAMALFDELKTEHVLLPRHGLLLRLAGLLHEVGGVVSTRAHHKHSYYLLANSEIFGLAHDEILMVAHIARYHRRSAPKPSHTEYMMLPRESRVAISKLAALLRVADALSRGHLHDAEDLRFERRADELIIHVPGGVDLLLEERDLATKGDLFEDIYGLKIRLEQV